MTRSYEELLSFQTFEERFNYLKLKGTVGQSTFGFDRYLNRVLYNSLEWRAIRNEVIIRDNGCDLAIRDREIFGGLLVHHINPITIDDLERRHDCVFDLNNLICTTHDTHNAIHYGDESLLQRLPKERTKGDTCPWMTVS